MSTQHKYEASRLTGSVIAEYLVEHPEFFNERSDLLESLKIPHQSGGVVSLVEHQISLLRKKNKEITSRFMDLVQVGRDNEKINQNVHDLTLSLMDARGFTSLLRILDERLRADFNADAVAVCLAAVPDTAANARARKIDLDHPALAGTKDDMDKGRPVCGYLREEPRDYLFGDAAGRVESAALVPLCDPDLFGILVVGSSDREKFRRQFETLFLGYLGGLVSRFLRPYVREMEAANS